MDSLNVVEEIEGELVSIIEIVVDRGAEKGICVLGWKDFNVVYKTVLVSVDVVEEIDSGVDFFS